MQKKKITYEVNNVCKYFTSKRHTVKAVDNVSFSIRQGETFGIVGESGCGKTSLGKTMMGILPIESGEVLFNGQNVHRLSKKENLAFCKKAQMVFQDPYASLDPTKQILDIIGEGLRIHAKNISRKEREEKVYQLINTVGLNSEHALRYPHEFSGGERQRIGIARALAVDPEFLLCDEPVSALDVSIQAQIINLLSELKAARQLTMLFISHDLSMVKYIADRVGVMYLGNLVEVCDCETLYRAHKHPYTKVLISSIPIPDPQKAQERDHSAVIGEASLSQMQESCHFYSRCINRMDICKEKIPALREVEPGHLVACHLYD